MNKPTALLILDDEINILRSLKRVFMNELFDVFTTRDAGEAIRILESEEIKVVMSDQRMPRTKGVDFLKQVKEKKPGAIRILFTGYADIQAAEDAINKGEVYRFITKPWNDEDLKSTIREAMNRYDLVQENQKLLEITQRQNSELSEANRRLKKMYDAQKEFTTTVSHELKTSLAGMKMAIDIMNREDKSKLSAESAECLGIAKKNADRLSRLVLDVLSLSKFESGKESFEMKKGNINQIIEEVVMLQRPVAQEKGLYLKIDLDTRMQLAPIDGDKINEVLSNLVNNAIKFTLKGGVIISSSFNGDRQVRVCVKDTGPGIAEADVPKLFQKFHQLGHPSEREGGGMGLGLAICKEIIARHKGKIWVEAESDKGCSFIFTLPADNRVLGGDS